MDNNWIHTLVMFAYWTKATSRDSVADMTNNAKYCTVSRECWLSCYCYHNASQKEEPPEFNRVFHCHGLCIRPHFERVHLEGANNDPSEALHCAIAWQRHIWPSNDKVQVGDLILLYLQLIKGVLDQKYDLIGNTLFTTWTTQSLPLILVV